MNDPETELAFAEQVAYGGVIRHVAQTTPDDPFYEVVTQLIGSLSEKTIEEKVVLLATGYAISLKLLAKYLPDDIRVPAPSKEEK